MKVDDGLHATRKVVRIPRRRRMAAMGLWIIAASWSAANLTDGCLDEHEVDELGGTSQQAQWLVDAGLWEKTDSGYRFHDWSDYQPTRSEVLAKRDAEAERKRIARRRPRGQKPDSDPPDPGRRPDMERTPDGQVPESEHPDPTRPDPSTSASAEVVVEDRADVAELCELLADLVEENGSRRPAVTKAWRDSARLVLDRDGRELEAAKRLVRWAQGDSFWRTNVLSMPTFRKQYDRLRLEANREREERRNAGAPGPEARGARRDAEILNFVNRANTHRQELEP